MFRKNMLCFATFLVAAAAAASAAPSQEVPVSWKSLKDVREGRWEAKCVYPQFGGRWAAARQASAWASGFARTQMDGFLKDARSSASGDPPPPGPYYLQSKAIVALARPELVSLYFDTEFFTGGAHPGRTFEPRTFGVVGARTRALKLQDLFARGVNARQVVSQLVIPRLDAMGAEWVRSGEMTSLSVEQAEQFVVTPSGISFLFQPYEAGTWADGAFVVKVPFSELEGKLDANGPLKGLLPRRTAGPTVTGTVTYRERMALPKDAVVDVSLIDASRADAPFVTLSQVRIRAGGKQVPIPFSLAYQPSKLRPGGIYQVRATISAGGKMMFTTDRGYRVITDGNPTSDVVLTLVRARG